MTTQSAVIEPLKTDNHSYLAKIGLVDSDPTEEFDKFTRLICRTIKTPVALVSIVEEERDRQFFTSQIGLAGHWAEDRQTPLTHSFCQHVKRQDRPLIVEDAPEHALVCDNAAIEDLNVRAYLGVPIHEPCGRALGALCAIDSKPRHWLDNDIKTMTDLAACVDDQIRLRTKLMYQTFSF